MSGGTGVCLVIGAGDGLGASIARAFACEGLRVCVTRRPRHVDAIDKLMSFQYRAQTCLLRNGGNPWTIFRRPSRI